MPTRAAIDAEYEQVMPRIEAGEADPACSPIGMTNTSTDYEVMAGARNFDEQNRRRRLTA